MCFSRHVSGDTLIDNVYSATRCNALQIYALEEKIQD
jgi:hypothetical protein